MKAVGKYIVITPEKEVQTETKGGLLLAEQQRVDIRYHKGLVISVGDVVCGIKENDKILAEVPEWNKLVVQMDKDWHSTTSITKPYYSPVAGADGKFKPIPMIRTTLQIFMKKEE